MFNLFLETSYPQTLITLEIITNIQESVLSTRCVPFLLIHETLNRRLWLPRNTFKRNFY